MNYTYTVGIDVAKATLDVCLHTEGETQASQVTNDAAGHAQLLNWLGERSVDPARCVVVMENTGLYHQRLAESLLLKGFTVAVEKTTVLRRVAPEHHRKDDRFDAALLCEYGRRYHDTLLLYRAQDPVIEHLRLLYTERRRLVTHRAALLQLQQSQPFRLSETPFVRTLWQQQQTLFDTQITAIEARIMELIDGHRGLRRRYEQLDSIAGIGPKTAWLWLVLFYGQEQLNPRQIASRFGFAPHARSSGTSLRRRGQSTGHGNREVRKLLTLCARSAGTHYAPFRQYKERKLGEGKRSAVVTNNLRNKLIRIICGVWNSDTVFDRAYYAQQVGQPLAGA